MLPLCRTLPRRSVCTKGWGLELTTVCVWCGVAWRAVACRWKREVMPAQRHRGSVVMLYMQDYHDQLLRDLKINTHRKVGAPCVCVRAACVRVCAACRPADLPRCVRVSRRIGTCTG